MVDKMKPKMDTPGGASMDAMRPKTDTGVKKGMDSGLKKGLDKMRPKTDTPSTGGGMDANKPKTEGMMTTMPVKPSTSDKPKTGGPSNGIGGALGTAVGNVLGGGPKTPKPPTRPTRQPSVFNGRQGTTGNPADNPKDFPFFQMSSRGTMGGSK